MATDIATDSTTDIRGAEIAELLNEVKQRVRARYSTASVPVNGTEPIRITAADLMPLLHARDAAQAKVASIGSVNPRRGGLVNNFIQSVKRLVSRSLGWFVRDQITFNQQVMAAMEATIDAMSEMNHSFGMLASEFNAIQNLRELSHHWADWRMGWEKKLADSEMQFLRSVAELQTGFSHRANTMDASFRDMVRSQHSQYEVSLDRLNIDLQKRLWADLAKVRTEFETVIHNELRVMRQRSLAMMTLAPSVTAPAAGPVNAASEDPAIGFDYWRFADRFRGSEEYVRSNQGIYLPYMEAAGSVLDVGCGRGEFLETLRQRDIPARGIELSDESVAYCRAKGLAVEKADLFGYLAALQERSEDAIFCSQVVEHIDSGRLPEMIRLCASRLRAGGLLVIETPNPECLAIFATHFYLDPTHTRPVPHPLLAFYMEECGMGAIEVHKFAPAADSFPEIRELPAAFADKFFGGLDYAIIGRKL